jgi:hypothetical protein
VPVGEAILITIGFAAVVALFVINVMKGKPGMALAGLLLHVTWYIGAIRLAKPGSWWARRYYVGLNDDKLDRAIARYGRKNLNA